MSFGAIFGRGITAPDGIAASVAPVDARTRQLVRLGAPVYIRVVPFRDDGPECDIEGSGVPGWVIMSNIPGEVADPPEPPPATPILEAGNGHLYRPPYVDNGRPTYDEGAYKVLEDHQLPPSLSAENCAYDPIGCIFLTSGLGKANEWVFKDTWYVYKYGTGGGSGGGGLGDVLGSFVTGLGGALSVGVNAAANLWNDAIAGVKSLALDVLITVPGIGHICHTNKYRDTCKAAISTGVTIALASMGVPPSLPNWDQLKYEGSDYLAALAAQAIEDETGLPAELTESQLKDLGHMAVDQMTAGRNGGNPAYSWVTEYLGFEPASVTFEIVKNSLDPLPPDMVLRTTGGNLFSQRLVPLPRRFSLPPAGSSTSRLRIPVVQPPQLTGIAPPYCFTDRYGRTTCTPSFFSEPLCVYEHFVGSPKGFEVIQRFGNCQDTNVDDIYYRDAWTARFLQPNCLTLTGFTFHVQLNLSNFFSLELEALPGLTMGTGAVVFPLVSFFWSGPFGAACDLK